MREKGICLEKSALKFLLGKFAVISKADVDFPSF
jgi:hypothetical protein